jgi:tripeptide aminopeptidase
MDNVEPCREVKPTIAGGIVRSAGDTVLGADDKAGIAAILEMLTVVKENDIPHGDIESLFDVAEETGLRGVKHLNLSHFRSPFGYCLDGDVVEEAVLRAPASYRITYRIKGHAAHAGVFPEKGINAIALASQAISRMKLGRIDEETTANVGIIHGGIATNIVPSEVVINAEARSRNETKLLKQVEAMHSAFTDILDQYTIVVEGKTITPSLEEERKLDYPAMNLDHTEPVFTLAAKAAQNIGLNLKATVTGGGSDANFLNCGGMKVAVLGHGVKNLHTTKEYIALEDLEKCANLITQIVLEHAKFGTV